MFDSLPVRSVFISDAHLGFRYCKSEELLQFLNEHNPEYLYLVGDFLDGWRLKTNWYWTDVYSQIVDRILELIRGGTQVFYTPGNHDEFLRGQIPAVYPVKFAEEFQHVMADGRIFCVIHGDLFDTVENNSKWLSGFGTRLYDLIMWSNKGTNRALKTVRLPEFNFAYSLKRLSKRVVGWLSRYQLSLVRHAQEQNCDGVICGHNHWPKIARRRGMIYANTGDWVEHTSALVELQDGSLRLLEGGQVIDRLDAQSEGTNKRFGRKTEQSVAPQGLRRSGGNNVSAGAFTP